MDLTLTNSRNTFVLRTEALLRGCVLAPQQYLRCLLWKTKFRAEVVDLKICECVKTGVNVWSDSGVRLERLEGPGGHDRDLRFY